MALGVVGLHDAGQPPVQCNVGLGVRGEDEQVGSIIPPADLFLWPKAAPSGVAVCAEGSPIAAPHCHHGAWLGPGDQPVTAGGIKDSPSPREVLGSQAGEHGLLVKVKDRL